jgi:hypothetical protein
MKRIKYISQFARNLSRDEIDRLIERSAEKNAQLDISGFLMVSGRIFLQLIEGPDAHIDELFQSISRDGRHKDVLVLSFEVDISERFFPDWSMRKFDLDDTSDSRLAPVREMLVAINDKRRQIDDLTLDLERNVLRELVSST